MIEALRDPAWQFVGVVVALLSIAAAFCIYWLQRQTKELAFGLVSSRRPLAIADELSSRVTVQFDGEPVGNLHLLVYALKNSGRRAIAPTDWERHLSISFGSGKVISAEVSSQAPSNIGAQLTVLDSRIELMPLLLNPGDLLLIQVLLSSAKPTSALDARVLDVSFFAPINTQPRLPRFFDSGLPLIMVVFLIMGVTAYWKANMPAAYSFIAFAAVIPIFGWVSRLLQETGKSARRRVNEV